MIKINLLETAKGRNKRGGTSSAMPTMEVGNVGSPKMAVLVVLVVVALGNGMYWMRLDHQSKAIAQQMSAAEQKNRELADDRDHSAHTRERTGRASRRRRNRRMWHPLTNCPRLRRLSRQHR